MVIEVKITISKIEITLVWCVIKTLLGGYIQTLSTHIRHENAFYIEMKN